MQLQWEHVNGYWHADGGWGISIGYEPRANGEDPYYAWVGCTFIGWFHSLKAAKEGSIYYVVEKELEQ